MGLLCARFLQKRIQFVLVGKGISALAEVLIDFPGVLTLAPCNILRYGVQFVLSWLKPVAEHIGRLPFPRSAHFYCREYRQLLLCCQLLQCSSGIHTIMISDGDQAKLFTHQVIDQLFSRPCAIAESGMHLEGNGSISLQDKMRK